MMTKRQYIKAIREIIRDCGETDELRGRKALRIENGGDMVWTVALYKNGTIKEIVTLIYQSEQYVHDLSRMYDVQLKSLYERLVKDFKS